MVTLSPMCLEMSLMYILVWLLAAKQMKSSKARDDSFFMIEGTIVIDLIQDDKIFSLLLSISTKLISAFLVSPCILSLTIPPSYSG